MDLAKWAYKTLGNSSLFRDSNLWQVIDPLIYSTVFPQKWPANTEQKVNETQVVLQAGPESTKTLAQVNAEIDAQLKLPYDPDNYPDAVRDTTDELSKTNLLAISENITESQRIEDSFDDTVIDYTVFFRE